MYITKKFCHSFCDAIGTSYSDCLYTETGCSLANQTILSIDSASTETSLKIHQLVVQARLDKAGLAYQQLIIYFLSSHLPSLVLQFVERVFLRDEGIDVAQGLLPLALRSTMSDERLTSLTLLHVHRDIDIEISEVIDEFARRHPRCIQLTNILQD